jgi:hypothetical protein
MNMKSLLNLCGVESCYPLEFSRLPACSSPLVLSCLSDLHSLFWVLLVTDPDRFSFPSSCLVDFHLPPSVELSLVDNSVQLTTSSPDFFPWGLRTTFPLFLDNIHLHISYATQSKYPKWNSIILSEPTSSPLFSFLRELYFTQLFELETWQSILLFYSFLLSNYL